MIISSKKGWVAMC